MSRALIRQALKALRGWRTILLLFLSAVIAALPVTVAAFSKVSDSFGTSAAGRSLVTGAGDPSMFIVDFLHFDNPVPGVSGGVMAGALLTLLLQNFLVGGIIVFAAREPSPFRRSFVGACRRYFWLNIKLTFVSLLLTALSVGLWLGLTISMLNRAQHDWSPEVIRPLRLGAFLVALLMFGFIRVSTDCARAGSRFEPRGSARRRWRRGFQLVKARPLLAAALFLLPLLLGVIVLFPLVSAEWAIDARSSWAIALVLGLSALTLLLRSALRVAAFGAVIRFVELRQAD